MKNLLTALMLTAAALRVAAASLPTGDYQSTTADYTPYREEGIADWRGSNDEMARLNGHMGHMGDRKDQPMEHDMRPAQPALEGMGGHHHPMGGQP